MTTPAITMALKKLGLSRLVGLWQLLTAPFDPTTEEGRARARQQRIALSAATAALAKVISVSTALISVPLTLNYLGAERYGMWMTMSSFIALLSFADLGIGNGLLSSVASAHGRDDQREIRSLVSSAYLLLGGIALLVILAFAALYNTVPWHAIFNVHTSLARQEAAPAMGALVLCLALAMPLSIVQRVQMGLQSSFLSNIWQCLSSALGLISVIVSAHTQAPLFVLVLGFMGAPLLVNALNSLIYFLFLKPEMSPKFALASRLHMKSITGTGLLFLVLQIVSAISYSSNAIIIAQVLGAQKVSDYAVPEKLFALIGTVLAMMLAPLWPAYSEAISRGDRSWVRTTLIRSTTISVVVATLCSLPLILFGQQIIAVWITAPLPVSLSLLLSFGVWKIIEAAGNALSMFLNGARIVKTQVIISVITGVTALALKIYLVDKIGVSGVNWAMSASFFLLALVPYFIILNRHTMR